MNELEKLKFELKEKQQRLKDLDVSNFVLIPQIQELVSDIISLQEVIDTLEGN